MRVLLVFGGRSGEHEVSVRSARTVVDALTALRHEVVGVAITRDGRWVEADPYDADRIEDGTPVTLTPGQPVLADVAFPVLHGPNGEDGSVQGLFEILDIPYVGAGVEGSAVGLHKVLQKELFAASGIPIVNYVATDADEWRAKSGSVEDAIDALGYPCFSKPVHLGSSVGISKIHNRGEVAEAIERALRHDDEVIVEAQSHARELEVGVVGDPPMVSEVGEVVPDGEFYDYRAKYSGTWTELKIPADVPARVAQTVHDLALSAFEVARCEGMARVDFFFDAATEDVVLNEINTIPGLTSVSMFPRVWEKSGVAFAQVVERVLDHATARHARRRALEDRRRAAHESEVDAKG